MAEVLIAGRTVLIDDEDVHVLSGYSWGIVSGSPLGRRGPHSSRELVFLSRLLLDAPPDLEVDHINGDRLDNRRANLRLCTHAENMFNRPRMRNNRSGFKGVYWDSSHGGWRAQITANHKKYRLGTHRTRLAAARAYDEAALKIHGEFARLNFPNEVAA